MAFRFSRSSGPGGQHAQKSSTRVEALFDVAGSMALKEAAKRETLKRYQKAVQRHMEKGARLPLKLSEYLEAVKAKRAAIAAKSESTEP